MPTPWERLTMLGNSNTGAGRTNVPTFADIQQRLAELCPPSSPAPAPRRRLLALSEEFSVGAELVSLVRLVRIFLRGLSAERALRAPRLRKPDWFNRSKDAAHASQHDGTRNRSIIA
jgi:hypothetical protein